MPVKKFLLIAAAILIVINTSIFGTLYIVDLMAGPTPSELAELKKAEQLAAKQLIYDQLPPLKEFKSKANYIRSIGEAASLCEERLQQVVIEPFSSEVNMIESRYLEKSELYKIYIYYETVALPSKPSEALKASCVVSGEKRVIEVWKIAAQ